LSESIKIENLSKQYRLGQIGTGTLSHDINRWWAKIRGKEDPFLKIGSGNVLSADTGEYVWALKDINLSLKTGEVLGVIGKNGAGKSTLLKLLSRVTGPTTGSVKVRGRIASLLEVGTGFHPELTGKENIFLNGAILGMSRNEIKRKYDEIVSFSGVEKYVGTPVKRYSSGMHVRLAFAVAAHLDPEIMVIDEVLAVGDAEFQAKCLGKMKDVAGEGRTILFVSHNMGSIAQLCERCILLEEGKITMDGSSNEVISKYLEGTSEPEAEVTFSEAEHLECYIRSVRFLNEQNKAKKVFDITEKVKIEFRFVIKETSPLTGFAFSLFRGGSALFEEYSIQGTDIDYHNQTGDHRVIYEIPAMLLKEGKYLLKLSCYNSTTQYYYKHDPSFAVESNEIDTTQKSYRGDRLGAIIPPGNWYLEK